MLFEISQADHVERAILQEAMWLEVEQERHRRDAEARERRLGHLPWRPRLSALLERVRPLLGA